MGDDRSLKEHIGFLETRQEEVHREMMDETRTRIDRNRVESEIRAAELALIYYFCPPGAQGLPARTGFQPIQSQYLVARVP